MTGKIGSTLIYPGNLLIIALLVLCACKDKEPSPAEQQIYVVKAFDRVRHAFGDGYSQTATGRFTFPTDPARVEKITMFIQLRCPDEGCNAWDMFANVRVQHPDTGEWLEIGRYITPYGVDNAQAGRGFRVDVTDFKQLLTGEVNLRSFVEVWGQDGWLVSVEFEIVEGEPDYPYYAVGTLLDHAEWSLAGVPYGEDHDFVLERYVQVPEQAEQTSIRTIITGWGHAFPVDPDGRPCAEWCFRTHHIHVNDKRMFSHVLDGLGCNQNPVRPQNGNWAPDRAGWCPGMAVPVRTNHMENPMSGQSFTFGYRFEEWTNNFQTTASNKHAYYAISSYVVVKSSQPIEAPVVH